MLFRSCHRTEETCVLSQKKSRYLCADVRCIILVKGQLTWDCFVTNVVILYAAVTPFSYMMYDTYYPGNVTGNRVTMRKVPSKYR